MPRAGGCGVTTSVHNARERPESGRCYRNVPIEPTWHIGTTGAEYGVHTRLSMPETLFDEGTWRRMPRDARQRWQEWRAEHDGAMWVPFCRAVVRAGFAYPPTPAETAILYEIVDARPNDAALWFSEAAKPQGFLRLQPDWLPCLRAVSQRWMDFTESIPEDEDVDYRYARQGQAEARETLKRIGWYRDP